MVETYAVEASLVWKTNVPEVLKQVMAGFAEVNRAVSDLKSSLGELTGNNRGISALAKQLEKLKFPTSALDGLREMSSVTKGLADTQAILAREAIETAKAYREMAEASRRVRLPTGSSAHGGGRPVWGHTTALDAAMGAQMAGDAGTGFFGRAITAAAQADHTLAVIRGDRRVTDTQASAAWNLAGDIVRAVPGSTVGGNLEILNDLKNTFGDLNEAMQQLGTFSRLVTTLQIMDRAHGGEGDLRQALNTAKFIEDQGGAIDPNNPSRYDPKRFQQIASSIIAVDVATGGRVDPAAMLAFQKQARTGGMMLSDYALYGETPYFANAFGASKLGTALFSDLQVMLGGRLLKEHEQDLEYYGVIPKGSGHYVKQIGPNGRPKYEWEYDPRSIGQAALLATDPFKWIHDYLAAKIIEKEHLDVTKKPDLDRLLLVLTQLAQRGTQAGLWADAYRGFGPAQKEAANIGAQSPDMLAHFLATDPTARIMEFNAAENQLMVTAGQAIMGPAIESLRALTTILHDLTDWAKDHPTAAKDILLVAGGLSVLSKVVGDTAMAAIFVGGPLISGLRALGGVLLPFNAAAPVGTALATLSGAGPGSLAAFGAAVLGLAGAAAVASLTSIPKDVHTAILNTHPDQVSRDAADSRALRLFNNDTPMAHSFEKPIVLQLDGRTIARAVVKFILPGGGVQGGITQFDPTMSLFPAGTPAGAGN